MFGQGAQILVVKVPPKAITKLTNLLAQTNSSGSDKLSAISQFGQAFLERTGIPGLSVAFARQGQMVHQETFGFASLERKEKLNPGHSFRIASVSKPITATMIFVLVERGGAHQVQAMNILILDIAFSVGSSSKSPGKASRRPLTK